MPVLNNVPPELYGHYINFVQAITRGQSPATLTLLSAQATSLYTMTAPVARQIITNPRNAVTIVNILRSFGIGISLSAILADAIPFLIVAAVVCAILYMAKLDQEAMLRRRGQHGQLQNLQVGFDNFMNESRLSPVLILKSRKIPPELQHLAV